MTLVMAARASDGVAMVSDKRDYMSAAYQYRDWATKQRELAGGVLVGFDGAGQWAEGILESSSERLGSADPVAVAREIRVLMPDDMPELTWYLAGMDPRPAVAVLERRTVNRAFTWVVPTALQQPWVTSGFSSIARSILGMHWSAGLDVVQVATLLVAALRITADSFVTVSSKYTLNVSRRTAPWTAQDSEAVEAAATRFMGAIQAVRP